MDQPRRTDATAAPPAAGGPLVRLAILDTYGVVWPVESFARDVLQNFFDATPDFRDVSIVTDDAAGTVEIRGPSEFDVDLLGYLGGTTKLDGNGAGGFGEGLKICALVALRDLGLSLSAGSGQVVLDAVLDPVPLGRELCYRMSEDPQGRGSFAPLTACDAKTIAAIADAKDQFYHPDNVALWVSYETAIPLSQVARHRRASEAVFSSGRGAKRRAVGSVADPRSRADAVRQAPTSQPGAARARQARHVADERAREAGFEPVQSATYGARGFSPRPPCRDCAPTACRRSSFLKTRAGGMTEIDRQLYTRLVSSLGGDNNEPALQLVVDDIANRGADRRTVVTIIRFIEDHPESELGVPGPLVWHLESVGGYEAELLASLARRPGIYGVLLLTRIINVTPMGDRQSRLILALEEAAAHPLADEVVRSYVAHYLSASC